MSETTTHFLGLDLATKTGFSVLSSTGEHITSGVWKFSPKKGEDERHCLLRFQDQLSQIVKDYPQISTIFFEKVDFCVTMLAYRKHCMLAAVVGLFSLQCNKPLIPVAVGTLKKYATGNGRAAKGDMLKAAKEAYPAVEFEDDNHADAMLIAHWGVHYVQAGGLENKAIEIGGKGHKNTKKKKKKKGNK